MAHHNSTPQTVLDAPKSTPTLVHATTGYNRAERRHGAVLKRETSEPNTPAASPRVRKVRRGRKARWNR